MTTSTRTDDLAGSAEADNLADSAEADNLANTAGAAVEWLEAEFPGWTISVDRTASWQGEFRPLWIARSDGHHPQAELTAAKLHTRLSEYLDRESRRHAMRN